jgi:TRAP-type transport system small permease protein
MIYNLFKIGALLSLFLMIASVTIQVFTRFFMESTPHWTEEAARIFFIYSVAFGTGLGIKNGDFIRLDLISKWMSVKISLFLEIITEIVVTVFALIIFIHSIRFVILGMDELSPALEITMGFVFASMSVTALAIILFTLMNLRRVIRQKP